VSTPVRKCGNDAALIELVAGPIGPCKSGEMLLLLFDSIRFSFFQVKAMEQAMNDRSQNNTGGQKQ
jgi:hypothetical protein